MVKQNNNSGAVALILVIMITTLTLVSAVVMSLVNVSSILSNYHLSEEEQVEVDIDSCIDDLLWRLSSTTLTIGTFNLDSVGVKCAYEIGTVKSGLIKVTTTASTTSAVGGWQKRVILGVNVSSSPISIDSYRDASSYAAVTYQAAQCGDWVCSGSDTTDNCTVDCGDPYCGDSSCNNGETCSTCSADCGVCQVCGNGIVEGTETCDWSGGACGDPGSPRASPVGCSRSTYCLEDCSSCTNSCL